MTTARATLAPANSECVILYTDHGSPVLVDPFFQELLDGTTFTVAPFTRAYPGLDPERGMYPGFHFTGAQDNAFFLYLDPPHRRTR